MVDTWKRLTIDWGCGDNDDRVVEGRGKAARKFTFTADDDEWSR